MRIPLETIQALVGDITAEPFDHVDYAVTRNVGLFVPVGGRCYYAVSPAHTHPAYSFVVSFDDFCRVEVDGKIIRSQPGTFSAFSPDVPHQELPEETPSRYVAVMVRRTYFEEQFSTYGEPPPMLRGEIFPSTPRLIAALREFMAEYEEQVPGFVPLLDAAGLKITHLIIRQIHSVAKLDEKVDFRMAANHAVEFMHKNLGEQLTLTDLARVSRLSPSRFARVFKAELGVAPIEYLQELRLLRAKRLLKDADNTVTEIALACGFNSSSYFSRCFQRRFGTSATAYRKFLGLPK